MTARETIKALWMRPGFKPEVADVPREPNAMLDYMDEAVGGNLTFFHKFRKGYVIVMNGSYFSYADAKPNRAVYATDEHVNDYVELYPWLEDWHVSKAGDPIGVIRGSFLVMAHNRDFETDSYATRSMTDAEIAEVSELFADERTGRLEELKHELGTIEA